MTTPLDPSKLDEAIRILDDYLGPDPVPCPEHVAAAWKTVRGEARRGRRQSAQALPAVSLAAQHVASARDHAQAAIEVMGGVFGRDPKSEPPEAIPSSGGPKKTSG